MMKILHITPAYSPAYRYGGPIKSVHELNKWLVKKGVDVTVYTTDIDGKGNLNVPLGKEVIIDGVKVFYFPVAWRFWQYSSAMRQALQKNIKDFDLVHITSVFLSASTIGAYYAKKFKKPYIISPRGSLMKETFRKGYLKKKIYTVLLEKRNLEGAAGIHFTSEMEKDEYVGMGFPLKREVVIQNGLDKEGLGKESTPDFRKKYGIPEDKKIILFLSRISWKKGLDDLIPAFRIVREKEDDVILVIAGGDDEGYRKETEKFISDNDLQSGRDVVFTGQLLGGDKNAAYKEAGVFVLPSYSENFGMVILESMYFGLAVVSTATTAIAQQLPADAVMIVKKDKKEIADAIIKILRDPNLAKKMGVVGRKAVEKEFSWDKIAEKFIRRYNELIEENG
ncbi:MAG: glycosyltransferase [Candidatus Wolfebacteria bacterium]|nr:glycosyltransferase [Candidatus Wolfebacteria bacterium]